MICNNFSQTVALHLFLNILYAYLSTCLSVSDCLTDLSLMYLLTSSIPVHSALPESHETAEISQYSWVLIDADDTIEPLASLPLPYPVILLERQEEHGAHFSLPAGTMPNTDLLDDNYKHHCLLSHFSCLRDLYQKQIDLLSFMKVACKHINRTWLCALDQIQRN